MCDMCHKCDTHDMCHNVTLWNSMAQKSLKHAQIGQMGNEIEVSHCATKWHFDTSLTPKVL
jgi:hypothetical protein